MCEINVSWPLGGTIPALSIPISLMRLSVVYLLLRLLVMMNGWRMSFWPLSRSEVFYFYSPPNSQIKSGAAIIQARGLSSAVSAANAIVNHVQCIASLTLCYTYSEAWFLGTPEGEFVSMGVIADGSYGWFHTFLLSLTQRRHFSRNHLLLPSHNQRRKIHYCQGYIHSIISFPQSEIFRSTNFLAVKWMRLEMNFLRSVLLHSRSSDSRCNRCE